MNKDQFSKLNHNEQLWAVFEKLQKGTPSGAQNEWESYITDNKDMKENYVEKNGAASKKHRQTSIKPLPGPPEVMKCECYNPGPWPHLMHTMDPIENFQSDALIHIFKIVKELKDKPNNNGNNQNFNFEENFDTAYKGLWLVIKYLREIRNILTGETDPDASANPDRPPKGRNFDK